MILCNYFLLLFLESEMINFFPRSCEQRKAKSKAIVELGDFFVTKPVTLS